MTFADIKSRAILKKNTKTMKNKIAA